MQPMFMFDEPDIRISVILIWLCNSWGANMRNKNFFGLVSAGLLLTSGAVGADDRADVLELMDRAFDAVATLDPDDWREIVIPEGRVLSFRPKKDGAPGELEMRSSSQAESLEGLDGTSQGFLERWTEEPVVMVRGPIASVWGEYEFRVNGEFSHCGVNALHLAKTDGAWRIVNWTYTVEFDNCPTAPD
jgi:hypothetical protein